MKVVPKYSEENIFKEENNDKLYLISLLAIPSNKLWLKKKPINKPKWILSGEVSSRNLSFKINIKNPPINKDLNLKSGNPIGQRMDK